MASILICNILITLIEISSRRYPRTIIGCLFVIDNPRIDAFAIVLRKLLPTVMSDTSFLSAKYGRAKD